MKGMRMQTARNILQAIRKMGEKRIPLTRVYRCLFSEDLFLVAYDKIGLNQGALTPGTEDDTADGMSLKRIRHLPLVVSVPLTRRRSRESPHRAVGARGRP